MDRYPNLEYSDIEKDEHELLLTILDELREHNKLLHKVYEFQLSGKVKDSYEE